MNYKVSKWLNHFTARQPEMFVKLWFISILCNFVPEKFNLVRTGSILWFNNFPLISTPLSISCLYYIVQQLCNAGNSLFAGFVHKFLKKKYIYTILVFHFNFFFSKIVHTCS